MRHPNQDSLGGTWACINRNARSVPLLSFRQESHPQPTSVIVSTETPRLPNEKQEAKSDGVPVAPQGS